MPILRAQIVFPMDSGLPEDVVVNTLHFDGPASLLADNVLDMVEDFYTATVPVNNRVTGFYSSELTGAAVISLYNLSDPVPRVPFALRPFTFVPQANQLPTEVALCLSYQGPVVSGGIQARRRGRIYLGPYGVNANDGTSGRPSTESVVQPAVAAAQRLVQEANASVDYDWIVFSRVNGTGTVVTNGWVDNAWDTQRRRGERATARTTFALP